MNRIDCPWFFNDFYDSEANRAEIKRNIINNGFDTDNHDSDIGTEISICFCKYFMEYYEDEVGDDIIEMCEEYLNVTTEPPQIPDHDPNFVSVTALTVLYSIVFALAVSGNLTVILVVIFNKNFRGNATSLICSLAIADLLITSFCMPFNLITIRGTAYGRVWTIGDIWCKIVPYMQTFAVVGNIFTLVAMATERYFVIVHPLKTKSLQTTRVTLLILCCVWLPSTLFAVPCAVWYDISGLLFDLHKPLIKGCRLGDNKSNMKTYRTVIYIVLFIIPMLFCSGVYTIIGHQLWIRNKIGLQISHYEQLRLKSTRRVIVMLVIVQVLFVINWAPTMTYELLAAWKPEDSEDLEDANEKLTIRYYLQWLAMCNSCLNPIVYTFMHEKFRKSVFCQDKRKRAKIGVTDRSPAVAVLANSGVSTSSNVKKTNNTCTNITDTTNRSNIHEH